MDAEWISLCRNRCMLALDAAEEETLYRQWPELLQAAELPEDAPAKAAPFFQPPLETAALRADLPGESLPRETALENAPAAGAGCVLTPRVL